MRKMMGSLDRLKESKDRINFLLHRDLLDYAAPIMKEAGKDGILKCSKFEHDPYHMVSQLVFDLECLTCQRCLYVHRNLTSTTKRYMYKEACTLVLCYCTKCSTFA